MKRTFFYLRNNNNHKFSAISTTTIIAADDDTYHNIWIGDSRHKIHFNDHAHGRQRMDENLVFFFSFNFLNHRKLPFSIAHLQPNALHTVNVDSTPNRLFVHLFNSWRRCFGYPSYFRPVSSDEVSEHLHFFPRSFDTFNIWSKIQRLFALWYRL